MARDALEGFIDVLVEDGERVPESDPPEMMPRYDRLAHSLRDDPRTAVAILRERLFTPSSITRSLD